MNPCITFDTILSLSIILTLYKSIIVIDCYSKFNFVGFLILDMYTCSADTFEEFTSE